MASESRWARAQAYERSYWEAQAARIARGEEGDLSWYQWRSRRLKGLLEKALPAQARELSSARVLEVGSGPVGIVSFLDTKEATAIDPLCDYYATQEPLIRHRSSKVTFLDGSGEHLPFEDRHFDFLIIDNVIDHVQNAEGVMREVRRVLRDQGVLYLTVNLHPMWGFLLHRVVSRLQIDRGHPHTFTIARIRRFLDRWGFDLCHEEWEDYGEARRNDLRSSSRKDRLKGIAGLSEFLYTSLSRRRPSQA